MLARRRDQRRHSSNELTIARGDADWEKVVTEASFAVIALARRAPPKPAP